ncbi:hypothetical protein [Clostridium saccharoperbutylacetonicum]
MSKSIRLPQNIKNINITYNTNLIEFKKYLFITNKSQYKKIFSKLKYKCSLDTINKVVSDLSNKSSSYNEYIFGNPLPRNYNDLGKSNRLFFYNNSFDREVNWCIIAIEKFSSEINEFLNLKNLFEINFYKGDYENANHILDVIEKEICVSIWSIENRLILAEYMNGLEGNKQQLNQINECEVDGFISVLAEFLSRKAERTTSVKKYVDTLNKYLEKFYDKNSNKVPLKEFFTFRLNFHFGKKLKGYTNIIFYDSSFSIIDRYLTLIKLFQMISSDNSEEYISIEKYIYRLKRKINDKALDNILFYLNPNTEINTDSLSDKLIYISDLYTCGKYLECFSLTKTEILENPNCFELYEYYLKSLIYIKSDFEKLTETDSLLNSILENMFIIYTKGEKADESLGNIVKITQNIGNHSLANQLIFSIDDSIIQKKNFSTIFKELNSKFLNPRLAKAYKSNKESYIYLCNLETKYKQSSTVGFWKKYYSMLIKYNVDEENEFRNSNIDEIRIERYLAQIFEQHGLYYKAIELNTNLITKSNDFNMNYRIYIYEKLIVNLYNCYLKIREINECISLVVDNFLDKEYLIKRLNIKELIALIESSADEELYKDISIPILYYLYDSKDHNKIYSAYDNFIYMNNVEKPSELYLYESKFQKIKLVYFLKNICISDNIDSSQFFGGTDDLEKERITICQWLTNLDDENKKVYNDEISNITQKSMIRKRIQQIDDSKIYVDIEGIKNSSHKIMKESFDRYIKLASIMYKFEILNINNVNFQNNTTDEVYILESNFSQKPRYVLFSEIFIELRDKFISRYEYGLDYYLGMRIRHGTILSQLRKQFDANNLITNKKDKESDQYNKNAYWENKFSHLDESLRLRIQQILMQFSKLVDDIIIKVPNKWLQVKTESKNSEGLFNFIIYEPEMTNYFIACENIDNYDEFVDIVFDLLWKLTDINLKTVRYKISKDLKQEFISCLDNLENDIVKLLELNLNDSASKELLRNITNCRTNIQNEIQNITRWFNLAKNKNNINFNIIQLFEVCFEIIKNIYPKYKNFVWDIDINDGSIFQGKVFTYFVDIILILLNNVITKCNLDPSELQAQIKTFEDEKYLNIIVKNNVSEDRKKLLYSNIENIRKKIEDINNVMAYASGEGGSGYPKIVKTLKYDLKTSYNINIEVKDNKYFQVEIKLNKKGLIINENTHN